MTDFETWLDELATQPLPGGVAAAATAAALGAALVAKSARLTLQGIPPGTPESLAPLAIVQAAEDTRSQLLDLAGADVQAYRGWLRGRMRPADDPLRREALMQAMEVPARIAETCQSLIDRSQPLVTTCWPAVRADLEVGRWLLETGVRAGSLAADENRRQGVTDVPLISDRG